MGGERGDLRPVSASWTLAVLSAEPEASRLPSGLKASDVHDIRMVLDRPDGRPGADVPDRDQLVQAGRGDLVRARPPGDGEDRVGVAAEDRPLVPSASQIRTSPPRPGVPPAPASDRPSAAKATAVTCSGKPASRRRVLPVAGSTTTTSL